MKDMRSSWYFRQGSTSRPAQIGWIIFGLIVTMFYFTRRVIVSLGVGGWVDTVDAPVYDWVLEHQIPWAQGLAKVLYWWGSTPGMTATMIVLTLWLCWAKRSWWPLATVAFTALGSVLTTILLKRVVAHERPTGVDPSFPPPESYSFPSGHTLNATALIGMISYLAIVYGLYRWRWWLSMCAALFILLMGASRVYLGHHWVSDVMVGLLIGAGWGAVVAILHYYFVPRATMTSSRVPGENRATDG